MKYKMILTLLCLGKVFTNYSMSLGENLKCFDRQFTSNTLTSLGLIGAYNIYHKNNNLLSLNKDMGIILSAGWALSMLSTYHEIHNTAEPYMCYSQNPFIKFMHILRATVGKTSFATSYLAYSTYMDRTLSLDKIAVGSYVGLRLMHNMYNNFIKGWIKSLMASSSSSSRTSGGYKLGNS